ncbi:lipase family protein [Luteolibacter ambystomatis]|uniref:Lipase family protein n=1 Tax=Luteolibacter ambystomatis TaxID=2824561 RepID=A0A975J340_9BACT|nr:lipase family protein [Luteolibacter ambystomatis]QUE53165.1 lipase family protein [Luteolibacter ambystomatis]
MASYQLLQKSGLHLDTAVFLAEASQAAYNDQAARTWATAAGFSHTTTFNRSNIQGFWSTADDVALLAFRGTSNPGQWIRNAHFFPVRHPWGRVHEGFKDGVADVETDLRGFDEVAGKAKYLWITGHSLGGALALITAARWKMAGIPSSLYTYGQPMVGLEGFADRFAIELPGRLVRFVNQSDIVPRVPPGFSHTGMLKRIVRPGVLEAVPALEAVAAVQTPELAAAVRTATTLTLESVEAVVQSGISEPLMIDSELAPLTAKQFLELQASLDAAELEGAQLEGMFDLFKDHRISEYIRLLAQLLDHA